MVLSFQFPEWRDRALTIGRRLAHEPALHGTQYQREQAILSEFRSEFPDAAESVTSPGHARFFAWIDEARAAEVAELVTQRQGEQGADPAQRERRRAYLARESEAGATPAGRDQPAPAAQPFGVSNVGAERLVVEWMKHLGVQDASLTQQTRDGGIDVTSSTYVAQVKHQQGSVVVQDVRALFGAATADGRKPVFFTTSTYTADSLAFANRVDMPLFVFQTETGELRSANESALAMRSRN